MADKKSMLTLARQTGVKVFIKFLSKNCFYFVK